MRRDLVYAFRLLRKDPGIAAAAILTLGIGVGTGMAVFSLVDSVLFEPLPGIREPERLIALYGDDRETSASDYQGIPYPDYRDYRRLESVLSGLATYVRFPLILTEREGSRRIVGDLIAGEYFSVLGVEPVLGRLLRPSDDHPAAPPAAVIGHRLWVERFGGDPGVVGTTITLNREPLSVVGVAPPGFHGPLLDWYGEEALDVFVPISLIDRLLEQPLLENRRFIGPMVVGRLREGVTLPAARAALTARAERLEAIYPETNEGRGLTVLPARRARFWPGRWQRTTQLLGILGVSSLLLLAIVCFNLASLMLARVASRRREIAVRLALGASRSRLVRQWLVESLLLVVGGGLVGALLAATFLGALDAYPAPFGVPLYQEVHLDGRALLFSVGLCLLTCLGFGLGPAMAASRTSLQAAMKGTGRRGSSGALGRMLLVVAQVAVSVVILVGAGVLGRSLHRLTSIDPGFATEGVVSISIDARLAESEGADLDVLYVELLDALRGVPGVESASLGALPLSMVRRSTRVVTGDRPGADPPSLPRSRRPASRGQMDGQGQTGSQGQTDGQGQAVPFRRVGPGYFETLSIPVVRGREFRSDPDDRAAVIVDRAMAERFWPDDGAVGQLVGVEGEESVRRVVGVVRTVPFHDLWEEPEPHFYLPALGPGVTWEATLIVRAPASAALTSRLREEIASVSSRVAVVDVQPIEAHVASRLSRQRLVTGVAAALGAVALVLVTVGIFGLLSFVVSQRRRETAIRIAIGAERRQVALGVLTWALRLTGLGAAAGLLAWVPIGRALRSELYAVGPTDPLTIVVVAAALLAVTALSAYGPARRATRVEPMIALRDE